MTGSFCTHIPPTPTKWQVTEFPSRLSDNNNTERERLADIRPPPRGSHFKNRTLINGLMVVQRERASEGGFPYQKMRFKVTHALKI